MAKISSTPTSVLHPILEALQQYDSKKAAERYVKQVIEEEADSKLKQLRERQQQQILPEIGKRKTRG